MERLERRLVRLRCLSRLRRPASAAPETLSRLAGRATVALGSATGARGTEGVGARSPLDRASKGRGAATKKRAVRAVGRSLRERRRRVGARAQKRGARNPLNAGERRRSSVRRLQESLHAMRDRVLQGGQRGQRGQLCRPLPKLLGSRDARREDEKEGHGCSRNKQSNQDVGAREALRRGQTRAKRGGAQGPRPGQDVEVQGSGGGQQERICCALRFQISKVMLE